VAEGAAIHLSGLISLPCGPSFVGAVGPSVRSRTCLATLKGANVQNDVMSMGRDVWLLAGSGGQSWSAVASVDRADHIAFRVANRRAVASVSRTVALAVHPVSLHAPALSTPSAGSHPVGSREQRRCRKLFYTPYWITFELPAIDMNAASVGILGQIATGLR